jgi:Leucine-rich repeat (LRR) protein
LKRLYLRSNNIEKISGLENLINLKDLDLSFNSITEIEGLDNLENIKFLNLASNLFTDIKGFENLKKLLSLELGFPKRKYILNGKEIPTAIARKMGLWKDEYGNIEIKESKMVKYCQFVKETGYIDFTTPCLVDFYKQWKKSYQKN